MINIYYCLFNFLFGSEIFICMVDMLGKKNVFDKYGKKT